MSNLNETYFIAKDNYTLPNNNQPINISVGNQFLLIESLEDNLVKLKPIDLDCKETEIILPRHVVENMSQPFTKKITQITRSQSSIKERICSLDLMEGDSEFPDKCNFSSFGHGVTLREPLKIMSMSYDAKKKRVLPLGKKPSESDKSDKTTPVESPVMRHANEETTWIKSNVNGAEVYINATTNERWRATCDESGRQYFYDETSRMSRWNLPGQETIGDEAVRPIEDVLGCVNESAENETESPRNQRFVSSPISDGDDSWDDDDDADESEAKNGPQEDQVFMTASQRAQEDLSDLNKDGSKKFGIRHIRKEHISGPLFNKLIRTERSGPVEKTKISENGKEVPKKWIKFFMVLTGPELFFYKDAKSAISKSGSLPGKAELKLKIQNLQFIEKKDQEKDSPRPGVILQMEDTGAPGSNITYLLRFSMPEELRVWQMALQFAKDWKKEDMYSDKANTLVLTSDKKLLDTACIDESSGDKQNIRNILKQFLKIRPSPESLEARGILKPEAVFGSSLEILCEQEKNKVPEFVFRCILAIEARGLHHSGIYRVSGNQAKIQKLRLAVDDNKYQLNSESMELETVTGAFKLFFKELKKPLLDEEMCSKMIDLLQNRKVDKKNTYKDVNITAAKKLVQKMRPSHYETAKALFGHLQKVATYSSRNLMDISNISMVWGPNLYSSTGQASTKMAVLLMTHNQIIDFLISRYSELFDVAPLSKH